MKYQQAKPLLDRLCELAILFHASSELRTKMFEALDEHIPHLDQGCFERGCPMDDELSRCPKCGGPADNGHDRELPPNPYHCTKCEQADELRVAYMMGYEEGMKAVLKKMEDRLKEKEARDA